MSVVPHVLCHYKGTAGGGGAKHNKGCHNLIRHEEDCEGDGLEEEAKGNKEIVFGFV